MIVADVCTYCDYRKVNREEEEEEDEEEEDEDEEEEDTKKFV